MPLFENEGNVAKFKGIVREELEKQFSKDAMSVDGYNITEALSFAPGDAVRGAIQRLSKLLGEDLIELTQEEANSILQMCLNFYDNFIAPFDIPAVPNLVVEPMVDRAGRKLLEKSVSGVLQRFVAK